MNEMEKRKRRCCFTGHRPQKLSRSEGAVKRDLERAILEAMEAGYTTFVTGMAYGVDVWAGEIVIQLKESNPKLHLIAAVPYEGFENRWTREWKERYTELLSKADLVRYICPSYHAGAYQRRNEWMVDHSALVIAVFSGGKSGTKNTIDYAARSGVQVKYING